MAEFHNVTVVTETKKGEANDGAILVQGNDFDEDTWIPKSVIAETSEVYADETDGTLIVKDWWAEKEGLV